LPPTNVILSCHQMLVSHHENMNNSLSCSFIFYFCMWPLNHLIKIHNKNYKENPKLYWPLKIIPFPLFSRTFVLECHEYAFSKRNIIPGSKIILLLILHCKIRIPPNTTDWYQMTCCWHFSWKTLSHIVEWRKQ